jgi:hypothetical protein
MTRDTQGSGIENPGPHPFTVQCVCAAWLSNTITVQASDIEDACRRAIETATRDSAWRSTGACGPTFVDAITEGEDADPWWATEHAREGAASHLPVPPRFAEDREAQALRAALLGLLDWAAAMGGWEAEAWRIAERAAGRSDPADAPRE